MPRIRRKSSNETKLKQKISFCKRINRPVNDIERFWSYVEIKGLFDCWEWKAGQADGGYGLFWVNGKQITAHRFSYQLYYGEIPKGKQVNHKCNNRPCCNPFHLYAGTHQDNANDMMKANRQPKGESHGMAKLTEKQVLEIRKNKDHISQNKLAKIYNVEKTTIRSIQKYKTWKYL